MSRETVSAGEQILQLSGQRTAPSFERASAERPCKGARGEHAQHSQVTPRRSGGQRGGDPSADHVEPQRPQKELWL